MMKKRSESKSTLLNKKYLIDGEKLLKARLRDPEFKKAYEEESLKFQIAQAIYQKRREKKISQEKLAEKARTTQKVISRIEKSQVSVGVDLLQRIAHALGITVHISFR